MQLMTTLLDRFAATLAPTDAHIFDDIREYVEWQTGRRTTEFTPSADDDVDLRTYLLHLRTAGADRAVLRQKVASLKRFYEWAQTAGSIASSPFTEYNFDRPLISRDQIRRRQDTLAGDPREREITRLSALNRLAEHLNRSPDLQTALDATLATLADVMDLRTAWAFLLPDAIPSTYTPVAQPSHDFVVAAVYGLPPGLENDDRYHLRCSPDCHCQRFLRGGRLKRAVNIVECTRLQNAAEAAGDTQGLLFHASVPLISQGRPVGIINVATAEWQFLSAADLQLLSAAGAQVVTALERARLYDLAQAQRARLERELEMARAVQASLLPGQLPDIPGFSLAADWRSAREVAGDFYDIFPLPDGRWGLVVADVSDKGAPAALYMAMTRSLIRAKAERIAGPAAMLMEINRTLIAQSSAEMFVTVFYAALDPATRTLAYANAGHNPPILRHLTGRIEHLPLGGPFLGLLDEVSLADATISLAPGDALVAYTDGLTDAQNAQNEEYGVARLAAAIAAGPATAPALLSHLLADLGAFTETAPQPDDITLFVVACGAWASPRTPSMSGRGNKLDASPPLTYNALALKTRRIGCSAGPLRPLEFWAQSVTYNFAHFGVRWLC